MAEIGKKCPVIGNGFRKLGISERCSYSSAEKNIGKAVQESAILWYNKLGADELCK